MNNEENLFKGEEFWNEFLNAAIRVSKGMAEDEREEREFYESILGKNKQGG
jgi:hypothetical protein